jgi:outer membrane protein
MLRKITLLLTLTTFSFCLLHGQNTWSLERCIEYAQQNNLSTKQAAYTIKSTELMEKQNQYSRLPSLSGRMSAGYQFGRTIDPTTNSFNNQRIGFNSYSLDAGVTLYGGGRINNAVKQSKINTRASKLEADAVLNSTSLNIAAAYLNILLSEEQLANAQISLEVSREQLEQTDKLIEAGSLPPNDRLDFVSQIARNEQLLIEAQNAVEIGYLNLKQLMEVDPNEEVKIVHPQSIEVPESKDPSDWNLGEVYTVALQTQPEIRAADLRLESSQINERIAKAGYLPTLSLFASLNTNFSSVAQSPIFGVVRSEQTVFVNGDPLIFEFENEVPVDFENVTFSDQLNENFGQTVGISLNVPIYSNHSNKIETERARLSVLNQQVTNSQQRQQLKANVQRAITDARASKENLNAARRSVEAAQMAFDNAEKRFTLGAINTLEYNTARNNLDQARVDLTRAKFQHIFNIKTVDFYLGRKITLD